MGRQSMRMRPPPSALASQDHVVTLAGLSAPDRPTSGSGGQFTVCESGFALVTVGPRQPLEPQLDQKSLRLVVDRDRLRYSPVLLPSLSQLPGCNQNGQSTSEEFRPLFGIDAEGNPHELPLPYDQAKPVLSALCWHPTKPMIAITLANNLTYFLDVATGVWSDLVLQHEYQRNVIAMAYSPVGGNDLAVHTGDSVCLWHIVEGQRSAWVMRLHPDDWSERPSTSGSLSYSPSGRFLAFASHGQPSISVWDCVRKGPAGHTPLAARGKRITDVSWSSNGLYLVGFSRSSSNFYVWDTTRWDCARWTLGTGGPLQGITWHCNQSLMMVAGSDCSLIHCVRLDPLEIWPGLDVDQDPDGLGVGGKPNQIAWSPTSQRLAISFTEDSDDCADMIAIIATSIDVSNHVRYTPIGWIRGPQSPVSHMLNRPVFMCFRPEFEHGALLCVAWRHGQITFYPMLFAHDSKPVRPSARA
ncbi:unnamed protein product (mitochondrion) [Plasmodiophora brassicae]|uniref:Anaphase-promoting complex subunit 4 WD40 domain-containing protein n=1 Tax=Plasmodiophora brassicae TaxID=37360 RepID=A0A0G4J5Q8_PLABS|nr:hypothetical protein PBRA_002877 [Plasmodiophora brassicae]SPQ95014.1 unnamed protein product [Plasmodiophora brassicae]